MYLYISVCLEWWKDKNIYRYIEVLDDIKEHY